MEFKYSLSNDEILRNNHFKNWSLNELHNLWPQMRFFYANGFTEPETLLDTIREKYNDKCELGMGIIMLEKDYLTAVAVRSFCSCFGCKYASDCPSSIHCQECSRMYTDHYVCGEEENSD